MEINVMWLKAFDFPPQICSFCLLIQLLSRGMWGEIDVALPEQNIYHAAWNPWSLIWPGIFCKDFVLQTKHGICNIEFLHLVLENGFKQTKQYFRKTCSVPPDLGEGLLRSWAPWSSSNLMGFRSEKKWFMGKFQPIIRHRRKSLTF